MTEEEKKAKARERSKIYYQKNKEKILARQKKYVRKRYHTDEEFRKRTLENHKKYEKNNLERVKKIKREAQKKYYQSHKEYYHNYSKKWSKDKLNNLENEIERLNENNQAYQEELCKVWGERDNANRIINELEKWLEEQHQFIIEIPAYTKEISIEHKTMQICYENVLDKLQELNGVDKE